MATEHSILSLRSKSTLDHWKLQLARSGNDTVVRCSKCGRTQYLRFANGLKNGWSECHGLTMPIVFHQADIEKAVLEVLEVQK